MARRQLHINNKLDRDNLANGSERDSPWSCGGGGGSGRRPLTSIIEHLRSSKGRLHNGGGDVDGDGDGGGGGGGDGDGGVGAISFEAISSYSHVDSTRFRSASWKRRFDTRHSEAGAPRALARMQAHAQFIMQLEPRMVAPGFMAGGKFWRTLKVLERAPLSLGAITYVGVTMLMRIPLARYAYLQPSNSLQSGTGSQFASGIIVSGGRRHVYRIRAFMLCEAAIPLVFFRCPLKAVRCLGT
ncbi:hypothetical protein V1478_015286 [Vespula squamosa]|uniref:Uncharacterized protein n=1 Tax=Vespula squamosa TaxID=30214 RepID=A0ABD2A4N1_VESSQ